MSGSSFNVTLRNNTSFEVYDDETILQSAFKNNIILDHSCLKARCSACKAKLLFGEIKQLEDDLILTPKEREQGVILTCNSVPCTDIKLDIEDLAEVQLFKSRIIPAKINEIVSLTDDVIKVTLRFPPTAKFDFNPGQYVNLIKGSISRSYSIAELDSDNSISFYIKNYNKGKMSNYWFNEAKVNDLLRLEGPLGTFFFKQNKQVENIIFLGTGTGIAPINSILQFLDTNPKVIENKSIYVYFGVRNEKDLFWNKVFNNIDVNFIPILSRGSSSWSGERGYVQDILLKNKKISLESTQVYACGSENMIHDAKERLTQNGLSERNFYSDAFVSTN